MPGSAGSIRGRRSCLLILRSREKRRLGELPVYGNKVKLSRLSFLTSTALTGTFPNLRRATPCLPPLRDLTFERLAYEQKQKMDSKDYCIYRHRGIELFDSKPRSHSRCAGWQRRK